MKRKIITICFVISCLFFLLFIYQLAVFVTFRFGHCSFTYLDRKLLFAASSVVAFVNLVGLVYLFYKFVVSFFQKEECSDDIIEIAVINNDPVKQINTTVMYRNGEQIGSPVNMHYFTEEQFFRLAKIGDKIYEKYRTGKRK